jgi:geranylgeranyl diphosphate synthase type II
MRYSCLAPGKRLRPALCIASAEAVGADPLSSSAVIDAGCALELVHCFSLIHDDMPAIDNDDLRRGVPTCHKKFGEALALLAGDALFALAFDVLSRADAGSYEVLRSLQVLSRASGSDGLVGGEVLDVIAEGKQVDANGLEKIHALKTGALIAASCEIGGLMAGGNPVQVAQLRRFGEQIGLSFQIVDDLLNELSTPEQLGKAAGSDRVRNKATYPTVHGIEGAREAAERHLQAGLDCLGPELQDTGALRELARYSVERLH